MVFCGEATTESCVLKPNFEVGAIKVGSVYACKSPKYSVHNTVNNAENAGASGLHHRSGTPEHRC